MNDVYCLTLMIHHFGVTKKSTFFYTPLFFHYFADIRHHSGWPISHLFRRCVHVFVYFMYYLLNEVFTFSVVGPFFSCIVILLWSTEVKSLSQRKGDFNAWRVLNIDKRTLLIFLRFAVNYSFVSLCYCLKFEPGPIWVCLEKKLNRNHEGGLVDIGDRFGPYSCICIFFLNRFYLSFLLSCENWQLKVQT